MIIIVNFVDDFVRADALYAKAHLTPSVTHTSVLPVERAASKILQARASLFEEK